MRRPPVRRSQAVVVGIVTASLGVAAYLLGGGLLRGANEATTEEPPAGGYRYTKSVGAWLFGGAGPYAVLSPFTREIWIAHDGSGRLKQSYGDPVFFGQADRAEWDTAANVRLPIDEIHGPGELGYVDLGDLPRERRALRATLAASIDPTRHAGAELFVAISDLLRETVAPPDLARVMAEVLAAEDGIVVRTAGGRISVSTEVDDSLQLTIELDAQTYALLREERVLLLPAPEIDAKPPVTIGYADYLESHIADRLPLD